MSYSEKNITPVIIIDEAQFISNAILHDLRIIFNFHMDSKNLAAVILSGQPPLVTQLNRQPHEALRQRIVLNYAFKGFSFAGSSSPIFTDDALELIHSSSNGLTRKINSLVFGLEDVGGYGRSLAIYLIEKKQIVKDVNPSLAYDRRKSRAIYKKSDSIDAESIAEVLLTKIQDLPDANPQDIYWTIGQVVNHRDAIIKAQTALKNQLHGQIMYNYPSYKKFFSDVCGKGALAFWEKYPSPKTLAGVDVEELAQYLRSATRNACSTKKANAILELVKADGDTTREYQESRDFLVQSHVRDIKFKLEELEKIEKELSELMSTLDYKLETMDGISTVIASQLVAEIGDINRFKNPNKLAMYAGIAPVNFSSGGKGKTASANQAIESCMEYFTF